MHPYHQLPTLSRIISTQVSKRASHCHNTSMTRKTVNHKLQKYRTMSQTEPLNYDISTSCGAATGSTILVSESATVSLASSAMKTSNSLSSSSAVLAFGRPVGRPTFDLGATLLTDRGALGALTRTGPVLHESNVSMHDSHHQVVRHTSLSASCLRRFQGAQRGKVARSCSTTKQLKCQAYLQTADVEVEQCQSRSPWAVLRINVSTSNSSIKATPSPCC